MDAIGIVCEYNPFHNGHIYHIQKVKELFPDSILILCLNGYFLERGDISILSKEDKTQIALEHGVDLVIELPLFYGTQSADYFAEASIQLLWAIGITHLVFGSETTNIDYFTKIAIAQLAEEFTIETTKRGESYPKRLNLALQETNKFEPNDLLAISYIKAILKNNYSIKPVAIKRTNSYHDTISCDSIISASNIREKIRQNVNITNYLPKKANENLKQVDFQLFFFLLKAKILTDHHLEDIMDVTEGLENKLKKEIIHVNSFEELIEALKSKRYTYSRIKRMLVHILLGIKKTKTFLPVTYIHIIGFNEKGAAYLKKEKKNFSLPTKIDYQSIVYQYEMIGALLYDLLTHSNCSNFDIRNIPVKYIVH